MRVSVLVIAQKVSVAVQSKYKRGLVQDQEGVFKWYLEQEMTFVLGCSFDAPKDTGWQAEHGCYFLLSVAVNVNIPFVKGAMEVLRVQVFHPGSGHTAGEWHPRNQALCPQLEVFLSVSMVTLW